jgi:hypothetical protein
MMCSLELRPRSPRETIWTTASQLDLLSGEELRSSLKRIISKIVAYFDPATGKHRLDLELSKGLTEQLGTARETMRELGGDVQNDAEISEALIGGDPGDRALGQQGELHCRTSLFRDGGIAPPGGDEPGPPA